jgi:hypothetical protein
MPLLKSDTVLRVEQGKGTPGVDSYTVVVPSPEVGRILPKIDSATMRFILTLEPGSFWRCYYAPNPEDLTETGFYGNMVKLNLLAMTEMKKAKDQSGRPCVLAENFEPTAFLLDIQGYYLEALKNILKPSPG